MQKKMLPSTAKRCAQAGWDGLSDNKASNTLIEARPTTINTRRTNQDRKELECCTARNVNGIQPAEGKRMVMKRILKISNENRLKITRFTGFNTKRMKLVKAK